MAYATRRDVYLLGLSAQAFVARSRPFDSVDATTATIRLRAHGLDSSDVITFEASSGGALPTGISGFTPYYPVLVSSDLIRVSLTSGGSAVASWASAGSGWAVAIDFGPRLDAHLADANATIDEHLTAHEPPILADPATGHYPPVLVGMCARMAARAAVTSLQIENAAYRVAVDRLFAREAQDLEILAAWKAGKPIQPRPTDETEAADNAARAGNSRSVVPWTSGML